MWRNSKYFTESCQPMWTFFAQGTTILELFTLVWVRLESTDWMNAASTVLDCESWFVQHTDCMFDPMIAFQAYILACSHPILYTCMVHWWKVAHLSHSTGDQHETVVVKDFKGTKTVNLLVSEYFRTAFNCTSMHTQKTCVFSFGSKRREWRSMPDIREEDGKKNTFEGLT